MNRNDTTNIPGIAHLKQSLATVLRDARVPLKAIACEMEKSPSTVYGWADPHDFDNWPSLKALPQLLAYTSDPTLIDYLASVQGRITVQAPTALGPADLDRLAELVDAFGSLIRFHAKAISDGTFSPDDARVYEAHANRLVRGVLAQITFVHGQAGSWAKNRKEVSA